MGRVQGRNESRDSGGLRPGGSFTQKMQIAGQGESTFSGTYEDASTSGVSSPPLPWAPRVTIEFFDEGEGTRVVINTRRLPGFEAWTLGGI
jgi:hypothetical protein